LSAEVGNVDRVDEESSVDLPPRADLDGQDQQFPTANFVDDAIVAHLNPLQRMAAFEFLMLGRSRLVR